MRVWWERTLSELAVDEDRVRLDDALKTTFAGHPARLEESAFAQRHLQFAPRGVARRQPPPRSRSAQRTRGRCA